MKPFFSLRNIHHHYDPRQPILQGADFDVLPHEKIALIGPNGVGKTTLFHLMVGLLSPLQGTVSAFGRVRRVEKDFHEVRCKAGLLFQDSDDQLFSPTVREDVAFGPLNQGKEIQEVNSLVDRTLEQLGMAGYASRITHRLSGGEKRLVALATVLAMEPKVLLLDEPTNALDNNAESRLLEILTQLPQSMVIISHHHAFLDQIATRKMVLEKGKISLQSHSVR